MIRPSQFQVSSEPWIWRVERLCIGVIEDIIENDTFSRPVNFTCLSLSLVPVNSAAPAILEFRPTLAIAMAFGLALSFCRRRKVTPIMLGRAAYLTLYAEVLREIGAPIERQLSSVRLPATFEEHPDAYVPVLPAMRLLRKMAWSEGIEDLGFLASQKLAFADFGAELKKAIRGAATLYEGLQQFFRLVCIENTNKRVFTIPTRLGVKVCSELKGYRGLDGLQLSEWLQSFRTVTIVRQFVGPDWCPAEIAFKSRFEPDRGAFELLPNTRFLFGQEAASIEVPAALLSLPLRSRRCDRKRSAATGSASPSLPDPELDFTGSLRLMLRSYLSDNYLSINLAAEIAGISVRTLQRRLAQFGQNYSSLVQQIKFDAAAEMLKDSGSKIIDVAHYLGYEDPAHFARAFRRIAGLSPREFRRNLEIV